MDYSQSIKQLRRKKGLTQSQLAELLEVKPTSISAWENGRNKPLMDKVEMMARIFNVSISEIIGDTFTTDSTIQEIYVQLNQKRQSEVVDFAKFKLHEQRQEDSKKTIDFPNNEINDNKNFTLAAHLVDPEKELTEEEIDNLTAYLDKAKADYFKKRGK